MLNSPKNLTKCNINNNNNFKCTNKFGERLIMNSFVLHCKL